MSSGANGDSAPGTPERGPERPQPGRNQPPETPPGAQPGAQPQLSAAGQPMSEPQPQPQPQPQPPSQMSQPAGQPQPASQPSPQHQAPVAASQQDPHQPPPHQGPPSPPPHHDPTLHPHPLHPPPRAAVTVPLGKMLYLCVAALGVINLFLGYVSAGDGDSMNLYKVGVAIYTLAPTMFFLAGLVAVRGFLPRERAPGALPAMISTAIFVTLVLSAISSDGAGDLQTLFLVFGAVQFVIAWLAYLFDSGVIAARR